MMPNNFQPNHFQPTAVQEQVVVPPEPELEPEPAPVMKPECPAASPPAPEEVDLTREKKEDKPDKGRSIYHQDFLLGLQFHPACLTKPDDLPDFSDILDKPPVMGMGKNKGRPWLYKQLPNIVSGVSFNDDVQLNKAEKAWKPAVVKQRIHNTAAENNNLENLKTQELLRKVCSILNKLTPEKFERLMKQVQELPIDTEERLRGVIDLVFQKVLYEPGFSATYANMCYNLSGVKVQASAESGAIVNFRTLLLRRCQKEFMKNTDGDEVVLKKQIELEAASGAEEKQWLSKELMDAKDKARRCWLANIKFIGELFKVKLLEESIIHDCVCKLLKDPDEDSLEGLCGLLSNVGKDLDSKASKPRLDSYLQHMKTITDDRKVSSRICFKLLDLQDLRQNKWVPRRADQGPKTIAQVHKDAEMEEQREQMKVQQACNSKAVNSRGPGKMDRQAPGGRWAGSHNQSHGSSAQDEGWNKVPVSKKFYSRGPGKMDREGSGGHWAGSHNQGHGSSAQNEGWNRVRAKKCAKPANPGSVLGNPPVIFNTNRFSAFQRPSFSDRRVPQRNHGSWEKSEQFTLQDCGGREQVDCNREREQRVAAVPVRQVVSRMHDQGGPEQAASKVNAVKQETPAMPPPPPPPTRTPTKPALTEEQLEKKSTAIIEEYLNLNDMKEALQCVEELNSTELLFVFVRNGLESTLDGHAVARDRFGLLLHQLLQTGILPREQFYKGLQEILDVAEDLASDIPYIWLYMAEQITPILQEGGIPMGELFREISRPLIRLGKAGVLLANILCLLSQKITQKEAGTMWREAGLQWKDFLPTDVDISTFVTEKNVAFTLGGEAEKSTAWSPTKRPS